MTRNITGHIHAQTHLHARCAAGRSFQRELAQITEITARTAFTAFIWTTSRGIANQTVTVVWEPIGVWVRKSGEWAVIHRCLRCGKISSNRVAADDNPMKLMALAMRPFGSAVISKDEIRDMTVSMEK